MVKFKLINIFCFLYFPGIQTNTPKQMNAASEHLTHGTVSHHVGATVVLWALSNRFSKNRSTSLSP